MVVRNSAMRGSFFSSPLVLLLFLYFSLFSQFPRVSSDSPRPQFPLPTPSSNQINTKDERIQFPIPYPYQNRIFNNPPSSPPFDPENPFRNSLENSPSVAQPAVAGPFLPSAAAPTNQNKENNNSFDNSAINEITPNPIVSSSSKVSSFQKKEGEEEIFSPPSQQGNSLGDHENSPTGPKPTAGEEEIPSTRKSIGNDEQVEEEKPVDAKTRSLFGGKSHQPKEAEEEEKTTKKRAHIVLPSLPSISFAEKSPPSDPPSSSSSSTPTSSSPTSSFTWPSFPTSSDNGNSRSSQPEGNSNFLPTAAAAAAGLGGLFARRQKNPEPEQTNHQENFRQESVRHEAGNNWNGGNSNHQASVETPATPVTPVRAQENPQSPQLPHPNAIIQLPNGGSLVPAHLVSGNLGQGLTGPSQPLEENSPSDSSDSSSSRRRPISSRGLNRNLRRVPPTPPNGRIYRLSRPSSSSSRNSRNPRISPQASRLGRFGSINANRNSRNNNIPLNPRRPGSPAPPSRRFVVNSRGARVRQVPRPSGRGFSANTLNASGQNQPRRQLINQRAADARLQRSAQEARRLRQARELARSRNSAGRSSPRGRIVSNNRSRNRRTTRTRSSRSPRSRSRRSGRRR